MLLFIFEITLFNPPIEYIITSFQDLVAIPINEIDMLPSLVIFSRKIQTSPSIYHAIFLKIMWGLRQ